MAYVADQETIGGYTVKVEADDTGGYESPREWDNVGTMVCWHRRNNLGDRKPTESEENALQRGGFGLLERYLRRYEGATTVLPLALLDHSGLHMWIGSQAHWSDSAGWDSGLVGFIYDSKEGREKCGTDLEHVQACLEGEVETYDDCLTGNVWGYVVEDEDGDVLDSCWGFYGDDGRKEALAQGRSSAEGYDRENQAQEEREQATASVICYS